MTRENTHCVDCGCELDQWTAEVFTCCDDCWDKAYRGSAASAPAEPPTLKVGDSLTVKCESNHGITSVTIANDSNELPPRIVCDGFDMVPRTTATSTQVAALRAERDRLATYDEELRRSVIQQDNELAALRTEVATLRNDKADLDWLDERLRDEPAWTDIVLAHDWEDGVWLSLIRRGEYAGARAMDDSPTPLASVREAIRAARSASGEDRRG